MGRAILLLFILIAPVDSVRAEVRTETFTYGDGDLSLKGYLAWDDRFKGRRPGVLVVHEWWGQTDYPRRRARMLAGLGYTAMAIDMYGKGRVLHHPKDAGAFARQTMQDAAGLKSRFIAALNRLKQHRTTDPKRTAAVGYCFGGGVVLHMARIGLPLKAVVSFHGSLATKEPARKGVIQSSILVLNGAADKMVKPEHITAFEQEMTRAGARYRLISYRDARHGFTNPDATRTGKKFNLPVAYQKRADEQSWAEMQRFLKTNLGS